MYVTIKAYLVSKWWMSIHNLKDANLIGCCNYLVFTSSSSLGLVEAIFSKLIIPALTSALDNIGPYT